MTENGNRSQETKIRGQSCRVTTFSTARILLVDDDADLQVYVKRLLSRQYDVEIVSNDIAALASIKQQPPDLVLISVRLSNLDELALIQQLRSDTSTQEIPIIVLSVLTREEIRARGLEAGANDYIIQPFSDRELLARVEANLKITNIRQEAQAREQELRGETEAIHNRVNDILESMTDAFVAFDHQWRYIYVNHQAIRISHKTREELLGKVVWEVFTEGVELNLLGYRELQRAMREQVVVRFEDFSPTLNKWLEVHAYPIPEGLAVYFQDITERKQVEVTLRENEERLKLANERFEFAAAAVNCLIYDWDLEKNIVERTEGLTRILGYSLEEANSSVQWWFNICHPEDQERIKSRENINWITQDRWSSEYRVRHKDGYYIHVLDQGIIVRRDAQGNPTRIVGSTTDITAQKQQEKDFREQELFLQNITDNVPVLLWTALPDGTMDFVSQPWINYTGLDLAVVNQQGWQDLIHPDELVETVNRWSEATQTRQPYEMTHRIKHSDGTYRWCISRAILTGDEQLSSFRWVGSAVDIDRQKRAETALGESEERFRQMAETIEVVFWLSDAFEEKILYVSPAYDRIWGRSREELYTDFSKLPESIHPDDQERVQSTATRDRLQEGLDIEYRIVRPDGSIRWVRDRSYLIRDTDGKPYRLAGFAEDITERKQAQQERQQTLQILQESEERFRIMSNHAPILIWMSGTDALYHFFNQPWLDFTGRTLEQEIGNGWAEGVHPDDLQFCIDTYLVAFHSHQPFEMDYRLQRADGEYRWILDRGVPRFTPDGNFLGYIGSCIDITERRETEQALRESEEALRQSLAILNTINEATPTFIYAKDRQGRLIMANSSVIRGVGKPESEIIGHTDAEFLDLNPDDAATIIETDRQIIETGQMRILEEIIELPQGKSTFLSAKSPYLDESGNIIGLVGVSFDITERKQSQEAIRESEQKLKIALHTGKLGSWQLDLVTGILECSSRLKENFGLAPSETLFYQRLLNLIHPDDQEQVQQAVQEAIETHSDFDIEFRNIWPDGSVHWIMARGRAIYSSDGTPLRMIGVTLDLTDRKRTEEALQESEERLRIALEASRLGMWYWDLESDTLTFTEQCKTLFGLPTDAMISYQVFLDALHPDDRQRTNEVVNQSIEEHENYDIEYRTVWPDGTVHWIAAKGDCLYDSTGKPIRFLGVAINITERKQTEEYLHQTAQEMISLNTELTEATAILQERNQELDQFVYIVSHDLKAPLRAISNLSQWIADDLDEQLPPENQQQMQLLQDRVTRMENLIDGLLNYSRINRTETAIETVDTTELLQEIIDSLAPPECFSLEVEPNLPILKTQRLPLSQVFANLISNAIKHHGRTDGKVRISANDLGNSYQFAVADNGQGISVENHDKVFAIFQTLGSNESKNNTGIGLAIVKKLVEKHGGKITLESQLGQGTTFRFTWPKFR